MVQNILGTDIRDFGQRHRGEPNASLIQDICEICFGILVDGVEQFESCLRGFCRGGSCSHRSILILRFGLSGELKGGYIPNETPQSGQKINGVIGTFCR